MKKCKVRRLWDILDSIPKSDTLAPSAEVALDADYTQNTGLDIYLEQTPKQLEK